MQLYGGASYRLYQAQKQETQKTWTTLTDSGLSSLMTPFGSRGSLPIQKGKEGMAVKDFKGWASIETGLDEIVK